MHFAYAKTNNHESVFEADDLIALISSLITTQITNDKIKTTEN